MSSERSLPAIEAIGLAKEYTLYERPVERLLQLLGLKRHAAGRRFHALQAVDFAVGRGEVVGIVGRNGAGKSTLLQMICGTLPPSAGSLAVRGRIAALLELGAGFNPDFTGRENVYLNGTILGLSNEEIDARIDGILAFADIGDFIEQPVKTYSSGMFVRLAFAVAVSVDPEILIIDEALSVGDGAFSRKSFDRIMQLKDAGKTILFCSHSMYQVEALCSRVLWLERGELRAFGPAPEVIRAYTAFLDSQSAPTDGNPPAGDGMPALAADNEASAPALSRITAVRASIDGVEGAIAWSGKSELVVDIDFVAAADERVPSLAVAIYTLDGRCVASTGTVNEGVSLQVAADGRGRARCIFAQLPLLRGEYTISAWLLCDRALFVHETAQAVCRIQVEQSGLEQGLVRLPHRWEDCL